MKKILTLYFGLFAFLPLAFSQVNIVDSLKTYKPGEGRIRIFQDPKITQLLNYATLAKDNVIKTPGYRVQVFAGINTRQSKLTAEEKAAQIKELFPEMVVYTMFMPPRWVCKVGDYTNIEEANVALRKLKKTDLFKEALIIKDLIDIVLD